MPVQLLIAQIVNGIIVGSMYALFASGLTLIWGTMKMLNFAHGEFFMLAGYLVYFCYAVLDINPALSTVIAVVAVFLLGVVVERTIIHHLLSRPVWQFTTIIATLGTSIILQNLALHVWGPEFQNVPYFVEGMLNVFGIRIAYQRLLILGVSCASIVALWFFLKHTRLGLALRATAQDSDAAQLYGVNILSIYTFTFGLSAALAALAAAMLAPITAVNPYMGLSPLLKGFVVVSLGVLFSSTEWSDVISFTFLVLVIWVRPWGLFGVEERSQAMALRTGAWRRHGGVIAILGLLCFVPLFVHNPYLLHLFILSMLYAMLAGSWNLINGYAGIFTFGHQAFFGLGAYASALLAMDAGLSPWITLWFGGCVAALAGLAIGLPVLRIRSVAHVAIVTLAFAVIVQTVVSNLPDFTRGTLGLAGIPAFTAFALQGIGMVSFGAGDQVAYYYVALVFLA